MKRNNLDQLVFENANEAFVYLYNNIMAYGETQNDTKSIRNCGFYIMNPADNKITAKFRKWNNKYAEREWTWYLSQSRSVEDLKKYAPIWDKMHSGDNIVNSNYGWQWNRNDQLRKCIEQLLIDKSSRRASISIFDGKEKDDYYYDTPCTMYINFSVQDNKLCMEVHMRSNDLVYGFCNDQYCFSKLQMLVAKELDMETGYYFHFANNLHIYKRHFNL